MHDMGKMTWDLFGEDAGKQRLPPGFRFHPTDEELITFYLVSKVFNGGLCGIDIVEVDLNRCEPWELPGKSFCVVQFLNLLLGQMILLVQKKIVTWLSFVAFYEDEGS